MVTLLFLKWIIFWEGVLRLVSSDSSASPLVLDGLATVHTPLDLKLVSILERIRTPVVLQVQLIRLSRR